MRECERRRREAIVGEGGPGPSPPGKFLNKRCDFVHFGMILSSNFLGILSFDLARKHCNGKKKTL